MLETIWEWVQAHQALVWGITIGSFLMFVVTLVAVPILVVRIPANYFQEKRSLKDLRHPVLRLLLKIFKNILGVLLLLAGLAMLVLPGQGVLTILIALMLMDFPGKRALELRIVGHPRVLKGINWLRAKYGHPPLTMPAPKEEP